MNIFLKKQFNIAMYCHPFYNNLELNLKPILYQMYVGKHKSSMNDNDWNNLTKLLETQMMNIEYKKFFTKKLKNIKYWGNNNTNDWIKKELFEFEEISD